MPATPRARISGRNVVLDAARDINLQSAKDTTQMSNWNSSSGGSIGIGANLGGQQNGFTLELAASAARGNVSGQSVMNRDTVVDTSLTATYYRVPNPQDASRKAGTLGFDPAAEARADAEMKKAQGMGPAEIARTLNIGRASVYRKLEELLG